MVVPKHAPRHFLHMAIPLQQIAQNSPCEQAVSAFSMDNQPKTWASWLPWSLSSHILPWNFGIYGWSIAKEPWGWKDVLLWHKVISPPSSVSLHFRDRSVVCPTFCINVKDPGRQNGSSRSVSPCSCLSSSSYVSQSLSRQLLRASKSTSWTADM